MVNLGFENDPAGVAAACGRTAASSWALVSSVRENTISIRSLLRTGRQQLEASEKLLARVGIDRGYRFLDRESAVSESLSATGETVRSFAAVTALIEEVERAGRSEAEIEGGLVAEILACRKLCNPPAVVGVLLEGIVETVREQFPAAKQTETAITLCNLLYHYITRRRAEPAS